ncbi:MAG: DUF1416 domain-containing protein [Nocardioidaceae bacterium]
MSCGSPVGGHGLEQVDLAKASIIQGVVRAEGELLSGAYVRLLDRTGEFAAEVPTDTSGRFRFFAAPGDWTLRTLAPTVSPVDSAVTAVRGTIVEVDVTV